MSRFQSAGLAMALFFSLPLPAQDFQGPDPGKLVARSAFGNVRAGEVYREVAVRYGREKRWRSLLENLVQVEVVLQEAKKAGIRVDPALLNQRLERLRDLARTSGKTLDQQLRELGLTQSTMRYYTRVALLREKLTARALGIPVSEVTPSQVRLWVKEAMGRYKWKILLDSLEAGTAAKVGERTIPTEVFGWALTAALRKERKNLVREIVRIIVTGRRIRELAEKEGIRVTPKDEEAELARRRANVKKDPRWRGATLGQLLQAKGSSEAVLRRSRSFRDFILLEKLTARRYPRKAQVAYLQEHLQEYLARFGESRHVYHIALKILPGKIQETRKRILEMKNKIRGIATFRLMARMYSEDRVSGPRGGDLGWVHRIQPGVPQPILDEAFKLQPMEVGGPVRALGMLHILMVTDVKPVPPQEELLAHVRADLRTNLLKKIIQEAKIEYL